MTSSKDKQSVKNRNRRKVNYSKPHMIVPIEDMTWVLEQPPTVYRLFGECWKSDPFGSRYMPLSTTLKGDNLRKAKNLLKDAGLFGFEVKMQVVNGKRYYETFVINYHGARSSYWKLKDQIGNLDPGDLRTDSRHTQVDSRHIRTDSRHIRTDNLGLRSETLTQQGSQNASVSSQKRLSNSSKELQGRGEDTSQCLPRESEKQSLTPEEAIRHVEGAKQGNIPGKEIIELLREYPGQWAEFIHYAQVNKWDLSKEIPKVSNAASEMIEQLKAKKRKKIFQID